MTHPFGNRRGALFLSGSEPLGAGRCPPACYDVDSRVADPVKLFSLASLARPSADGKKAHPAGDTAQSSLAARPLSLRQLSLRRRAKTYQQSANDTVMMLLREPEDCDAKLRATPRGAPTPGSFAQRCRSAQRSTRVLLSPLCDLSPSSVQHNPQATRS